MNRLLVFFLIFAIGVVMSQASNESVEDSKLSENNQEYADWVNTLKAIEELADLKLENPNEEEDGVVAPIKRDANAPLKDSNMKNLARTTKTKKLPSEKGKGKHVKGIMTPAELERHRNMLRVIFSYGR